MWSTQGSSQPTALPPQVHLWIAPEKDISNFTVQTRSTMKTSLTILAGLGLLLVTACVLGQSIVRNHMNQCIMNADCADDRTCIDLECKDPCLGACDDNTVCKVRNHVPYCSCRPGFTGDPFNGCRTQSLTIEPQCTDDDDCPNHRTCINQKCEDPCLDVCRGNTTTCRVRNHIPYCTCKSGFSGDPMIACKPLSLPGSWPPYPGAVKRYQLELIKTNWYGAFAHCLNHGGRLATISNYEENERIKTAIKKTGLRGNFWASGTNYALGDHWTWISTGSPLTFTDWTHGQPDDWQNLPGGEHCLEFWEEQEFRWNDRNCLEQQYSVCEHYDPLQS